MQVLCEKFESERAMCWPKAGDWIGVQHCPLGFPLDFWFIANDSAVQRHYRKSDGLFCMVL